MELPGISSALPFNMSRVFDVCLAYSSVCLTYREVDFDRSKSNWGMGRTLPVVFPDHKKKEKIRSAGTLFPV